MSFRQALQNFGGRVQVIRLKNSAAPEDKRYQVRLNWRPEFAFMVTMVDQGSGSTKYGTGIKVDGSTYGNARKLVYTGNQGGQDEVGDLLEIKDWGLEVGKSAHGFHAANREVGIIAFQSDQGLLTADLGDVEVLDLGVDERASAFDYPSPLGDSPSWLFIEPDPPVVSTPKTLLWEYGGTFPTSLTSRWTRAATQGGGQWQRDASGSTSTSGTGPGTNNALPYVYTETSGSVPAATLEANSILTMKAGDMDPGHEFLTEGHDRSIVFRCCLQGPFLDLSGEKAEGLDVQVRAEDTDPWVSAGLIRGWQYSDSRSEGDMLTDYGGVEREVVADGGWADIEVEIPDTAKQLRLQASVVVPPAQNTYVHDIALLQTRLNWTIDT